MIDIVIQLRENADLDAAEHVPHEVVRMQYAAADEIERLRAEVAHLSIYKPARRTEQKQKPVKAVQIYAATRPGIASAPGRLKSWWRLVIVTRRLRPDGGSLRKQFCLRRAAVGCTKPERHHHPPGGTE